MKCKKRSSSLYSGLAGKKIGVQIFDYVRIYGKKIGGDKWRAKKKKVRHFKFLSISLLFLSVFVQTSSKRQKNCRRLFQIQQIIQFHYIWIEDFTWKFKLWKFGKFFLNCPPPPWLHLCRGQCFSLNRFLKPPTNMNFQSALTFYNVCLICWN